MEQGRKKNYLRDVVIVRDGPAGLSATIYMTRARYKVLLMEKEKTGGQITITSEIVNYPGVGETSGKELTHSMEEQAQAFGTESVMAEVLDMDLDQDIKVLHTTAGEYKALRVVLATGANPRKLGFKGEKEFQDRDVACYATCDGGFFTGIEASIVGGEFAAVEGDIFLIGYARGVTLVVRGDDFTCTRAVAGQVEREDEIEVKSNTEILETGGKHMASYTRSRSNRTGGEQIHETGENGGSGIFVLTGYVPDIAWTNGKLVCDERSYLVTDSSQRTSVEGVCGVGSVCIKNLRQVMAAVSDGAVAATSLEKHVSSIHEKLDIPALKQGETDTKHLEGEMTGGGRTPGKGSRGDGARGEDTRGEGTRAEDGSSFLSTQIRQRLPGLLPKFQEEAVIAVELGDSPLAGEMGGLLGKLEGLAGRIVCKREYINRREKERWKADGGLFPAFRLDRQDGREGNILFHGVPEGHEFNSFIVTLYNMAGPGRPLDEGLRQRLSSISKDTSVKVMVSLSCTMYPKVVMAAQGAASLSGHVTTEIVDLMHYLDLRERYSIISVPCMVISGSQVHFGKRSLEEVTELLEGN